MNWQEVYREIDFLHKYTIIDDMWISPVLTVIIKFRDWDGYARKYDSVERFCYIFRDGQRAYGQ